jgi:PII-like signaling protein
MIPERASLLRLYVNGSMRYRGKPLHQAVVEDARAMGLAGASVFLTDLAYGVKHQLRDARSEYLFVDIPVVVEIVDDPDKIEELLERLRPMVAGGFATVEPVRVVCYSHHGDGPDTG